MRLFIDNQELNAAIATVIKAMSTRTTMQVLEGIFLEATFKDGVRMKCSDLSLQIETFVPATVEEEGVLVVPGSAICQFRTLDICARPIVDFPPIMWQSLLRLRGCSAETMLVAKRIAQILESQQASPR